MIDEASIIVVTMITDDERLLIIKRKHVESNKKSNFVSLIEK